MEIGDKVKIIYSPYLSVKKGTIATIVDIKFKNYGKWWTLYILDTKPCSSFRENELEKIIETWEDGIDVILEKHHEAWEALAKL